MFTGIIEDLGEVKSILKSGTNLDLWVESGISNDLQIDQSVSHNGVCLTVVELSESCHRVTAVDETLIKSNLGSIKKGDLINLERSMAANGRFDGHIVQGHVDKVATCESVDEKDGSWIYQFNIESDDSKFIVEKGSVCINGISLTCFNVSERRFNVAIIPYTYEHTNLKEVTPGDQVNIEFDILGKYIQKLLGSNIRG